MTALARLIMTALARLIMTARSKAGGDPLGEAIVANTYSIYLWLERFWLERLVGPPPRGEKGEKGDKRNYLLPLHIAILHSLSRYDY
jgi:hypothetical protein